MNTIANGNRITLYGFIVVLIAALYFFLDSMLAVFPVALTNQLMSRFHVAATGVSFFAAIYFYVYAPLQLPCGQLLDKFGAKRIMIVGCVITIISLTIFAYTENFTLGCLARLLMGVGASAGYLAPMLLVVRWFPYNYYVIMTGFIVFIECIGAIFGGTFVSYLTNFIALKSIILLVAAIGLILLVLIVLFVKDWPNNKDKVRKNYKTKPVVKTLISVSLNLSNWMVALIATLFWAPVSIFAALWGISFLQVVYHLPKNLAGELLIMVWLGIGMISPIWGILSNYFQSRIKPIQIGALFGFISSIIIILVHKNSLVILSIALFIMGAASACQVLTFGIMRDKHTDGDSATAFGFNNMIICFGNAFFQLITGFFLDKLWDGKHVGLIKNYSAINYEYALLLIPICYLVVFFIASFFVKESYVREQKCYKKIRVNNDSVFVS